MNTYTLLQAEATPPTVDQLKRAFTFTETLRAADAAKAAAEARGVLLKNLTYDIAYRIQCALKENGIATEIVEPGALPVLPEFKLVRRLELTDPALQVYDVLGRATPVAWDEVEVIAAGAVGHLEFTTTHTEERVDTFSPIRGFHQKTVSETQHVLQAERQLLLEILLSDRRRRFQVEGKSFLFGYCFKRPELSLEGKFALLVQLLVERAPHTLRNRGAQELIAHTLLEDYASKAALNDEIVWLLWRKQTASGAG